MAHRDIIVIGASAGGVEALKQFVRSLPSRLPGSMFGVLHFPAEVPSALPEILNRAASRKIAVHPEDGEAIKPDCLYIARPDYHMLLEPGRIRIVRGPKENRHRPAIDPLFRSAALVYGPRVAGVILSGTLDDGTAGVIAIKKRGGIAIVQDPEDALHPGMSRSALENAEIDYCLPVTEIPPLLTRLAAESVKEEQPTMSTEMKSESKLSEGEQPAEQELAGKPSGLTCPDCHGVLWEIEEGDMLRFRCRVGHAYTAGSLVQEQSDALERALWAALRSLEESVSLARRLAAKARQSHYELVASRFEQHAKEKQQHVGVLRQVLVGGQTVKELAEITGEGLRRM
jgi:two-component system chemotaxis response regulator CheB